LFGFGIEENDEFDWFDGFEFSTDRSGTSCSIKLLLIEDSETIGKIGMKSKAMRMVTRVRFMFRGWILVS
jgi:hypothetical protein